MVTVLILATLILTGCGVLVFLAAAVIAHQTTHHRQEPRSFNDLDLGQDP